MKFLTFVFVLTITSAATGQIQPSQQQHECHCQSQITELWNATERLQGKVVAGVDVGKFNAEAKKLENLNWLVVSSLRKQDKDYKTLQRQHELHLYSTQNQMSALTNTTRNLQIQMKTSESEISRLGNIQKANADTIKKQGLEIQTSQVKNIAQDSEIKKCQAKIKSQDNAIQHLETTLKTFEAQMKNLTEKIQEMEKFQFVDVYGVAVGYDDSVLVNKNLITAYVKIDDKRYSVSRYHRGYNVLAVSGTTGQVIKPMRRFDQYGDSTQCQKLQAYINKEIPEKSIVVVVSFDEPSENSKICQETFKTLGGRTLTMTKADNFRDAYALIGYKGLNKPPWVQTAHAKRYQGPAIVSARIPLIKYQ